MAVCSASGWRSPLRRAAPRACPLLPYRDKVLHLVEGRRGQDSTSRRQAQEAFRILFRSGLATAAGVARLREELGEGAVARRMVAFIEGSKRGIVGAGAPAESDGAELSERVQ